MASQPTLTILPPAPQEEHYDQHIFERKPHTVSGETKIDWSDAPRIHLARSTGKARRWIPQFANNEKQLRHVIAQAAWKHMHKHHSQSLVIPPGLAEDFYILELMCIEYDKKRAPRQRGREPWDQTHCMWFRHFDSSQLAGSYLKLISTIAYRSWKLGQDSVTIAEQMGLSPVGVRQHLYRLVRTARHLGYEAHKKPHHSLGTTGRLRTPHRVKLPPGPQLVQEVERDGYKAVAERYDVKRGTVYKAYDIAAGYTDSLGRPTGRRPTVAGSRVRQYRRRVPRRKQKEGRSANGPL